VGSNWWLKFLFVVFLIGLAVRALVPTFAFPKQEYIPLFQVEKDTKGEIKYEKYVKGKRKGKFVKDENGQKIPVFHYNKKLTFWDKLERPGCVAQYAKNAKTKKPVKDKKGRYVRKWLMVPVLDKEGNPTKKDGKVIRERAKMTEAVWERCYLPTWYRKAMPYKKQLRLGLDLQGGTHLVLQVDVEKAINNKLARISDDLGHFLKQKKIIAKPTEQVFHNPDAARVEVTLPKESKVLVGMLKKIRKSLTTQKIVASGKDVIYRAGENIFTVKLAKESDAKRLRNVLTSTSKLLTSALSSGKKTYQVRFLTSLSALFRREVEKRWDYMKVSDSTKPGVFFVRFSQTFQDKSKESAVSQAIETIRGRVNALGVSEPSISRYGTTQIVIQLPGLKNPRRAKELIGKTALLAFHVVEDDSVDAEKIFREMGKKLPKGVKSARSSYDRPDGRQPGEDRLFWSDDKKTMERFVSSWNKKLPNLKPEYRKYKLFLGPYETGDATKKERPWRTYLVHRKADLTGDDLEEARPQLDSQTNRPEVGLTFTRKGGDLFERMTGAHIGHRFAIVLEGNIDSAPVIQTRIGGGRARITLGGMKSYEESLQDAKDLSFVLKSGSLPAPVNILYEKTVGPALGKDSIQRGAMSLLIGFILVIIFMFIFYRGAGLNANLALLLNMLFVMGVMASFGAVLTLPGMAGILLTIGMAVDANILIFERIREELRAGKTVRVAIQNGYDKAFVTILDANVTTAIAGIVLYQYGSGPIRGFAVTLLIGIICSVFTALVVTRMVFEIFIRRNIKRLSI